MKISGKSVFGSVVIMQVFGAFWYSQIAFAPSWAAAQGRSLDQLVPTVLPFVFSIAYAIVSSYAIAWTLRAQEVDCPVGGAVVGSMIGFALTVPAIATHYSFLQLNSWLIVVDAGKELVTYALSGAYFGFLASRFGEKVATAST